MSLVSFSVKFGQIRLYHNNQVQLNYNSIHACIIFEKYNANYTKCNERKTRTNIRIETRYIRGTISVMEGS